MNEKMEQLLPLAPKKLAFVLLLLIFVRSRADQQQVMSACQYPHFSDSRLCGIHDASSIMQGWICDPNHVISMSEVYMIDDTLKRVYAQHENSCQCRSAESQATKARTKSSGKKPCWYKFGFAFVRELNPTTDAMTEAQMSEEHCKNSSSQSMLARNVQHKGRGRSSPTAETAFLYAQNFARIVRERWSIGGCGEDILVLVVQVPPEPLISKQPSKSAHIFAMPMLFLSYGSHVVERFGVVDTYTLPYALEPLRRIVDEANANLRNAYPLNKVLNHLVLRTVDALNKAENALTSSHPKSRSHVPLWAWTVFGACGVTCVLMGIGLCLIRTTTRRGTQRGKSGNVDAVRRWKAGFVGGVFYPIERIVLDENQPTTYVKAMNLISIMMPSPKQPSANQPQQV